MSFPDDIREMHLKFGVREWLATATPEQKKGAHEAQNAYAH